MSERLVLLRCFTTVRRLERLSFLQEIGNDVGQSEDDIDSWEYTVFVRNLLHRWKHFLYVQVHAL